MTKHFNPGRARGFAVVKNDVSNVTQILNEMRSTFEAFKAERDKELSDIRNGMGDYVQSDKVDRINAEISNLQTALDDTNRMLAAATIGAGGAGDANPDVAAHSTAFNSWFRRGDRAIDADMRDLEVRAELTTENDEEAGFLLPEQMATEVERVAGTVSVMRQIAQVMQISAPVYKKLVNLAGTGSGWVGEKQSRSETDTPNLSELVFNLMEIYANPAATQRSLDDPRMDLARWLADEVAIEFAEQEGNAFIKGDGVNMPRGILGYDTVTNDNYAWGKVGYVPSLVAGALTNGTNNGSDQLITLYGALRQQYRTGGSWIMTDKTMMSLRKLKDGDGTFLFKLPDSVGDLPSFLGKPIHTDDNMDEIAANKFPIGFGNFRRGYLIVDGFGIRVLRDPYTNKPYVHFYTTKRVGGGISNFEAIKLMKIATS